MGPSGRVGAALSPAAAGLDLDLRLDEPDFSLVASAKAEPAIGRHAGRPPGAQQDQAGPGVVADALARNDPRRDPAGEASRVPDAVVDQVPNRVGIDGEPAAGAVEERCAGVEAGL